jgi:hypothetical protein
MTILLAVNLMYHISLLKYFVEQLFLQTDSLIRRQVVNIP